MSANAQKRDMVIRWHECQQATPEDTARLLGLTLDEVQAIIADSRRAHPSVKTVSPEFVEPTMF